MKNETILQSLNNGLTYFNQINNGSKEEAEKTWDEQNKLLDQVWTEAIDECISQLRSYRFFGVNCSTGERAKEMLIEHIASLKQKATAEADQ